MQLFFLNHLNQFFEFINAYLLLLNKAGDELHVGSAEESVNTLLVHLLGILFAAYGRLVKKETCAQLLVGPGPGGSRCPPPAPAGGPRSC